VRDALDGMGVISLSGFSQGNQLRWHVGQEQLDQFL
jgi:hypothetical protein